MIGDSIMANKINLAVLFGGISSEHEVSCISAATILRNLDREKYNIIKVGITKEGKWYHTEAPEDLIEKDKWQDHQSNRRAMITPDRGFDGLIYPGSAAREVLHIDCVYLALHGNYAEDGAMQGLLDIAGIPYTGSGVAASASGMDKSLTKLVVTNTGVKQADHFLVRDWMAKEDPAGLLDDVEKHFGRYPLFVKPASEGSSVGCSKVKNREQLETGIDLALKFDNKVLVEEAIVGREMEVAVLGNKDPKATVPGEIIAANEFYDYDAKYLNAASMTRVADDLPQKIVAEFRESAIKIYKALDCRGLARVDFFLQDDGTIVFNEINTLPGFTSISMYPQLWAAEGLQISDLLDELINCALE